MYQMTISVVAEEKDRKAFEKKLESLSKKWSHSVIMYKPSNNSEVSYQAIAVFEFPQPLIPEIIELIQNSCLWKVWYKYEDENGSIGAKEFISGNEEYTMCGSKAVSKDDPIIDTYRQSCEDFSKKCAERADDVVIDITEDQQLHIRKYEGDELRLIIDGIIEKDNRTGNKDYWL